MSLNRNQLSAIGIIPSMKSGISNNVLLEDMFEYKLQIDGNDRDTSLYRQPFQFRVELSEATNRRPSIGKSFKNVRAIRLDRITLPKSIAVNTQLINITNQIYPMGACANFAEAPPCCPSSSGGTSSETVTASLAITDCLQLLTNQPYLIVKVDEIATPTILGTNINLDNNCMRFMYDQDSGNDSATWIPYDNEGMIKYKHSQLRNFKSLTISILYPNGTPVTLVDQNNNPIVGINNTIYTDVVNGALIKYDYVAYTNAFKDLNNATDYTWNTMKLTFGCTLFVIENEMDTNINYQN
jgi:hypothetical protein